MYDICDQLKNLIAAKITAIASSNNITLSAQDLGRFNIEPSKEESHGDLACNAALVLIKNFSKIPELNSPNKLAQAIAVSLKDEALIAKVEVAGVGFINLFLSNHAVYKVLAEYASISSVADLKFANLGKGEKVNLEYASPNPTGPVHIGHARGAIYGDVLANLLSKVGYDVLKEYYINDAGNQIQNLLKSVYFRYLEEIEVKNFSDSAAENPGLYPGDYLVPIAQLLKQTYGDSLKDAANYAELIRDLVIAEMMKIIIADLKIIGINHDNYFSEKKELHDRGKINTAIDILANKDLTYRGKLEAPKSAKAGLEDEYEDRDQLLFRSTKYGDDSDRVLKKSDETPTYLAGDVAYSLSKFERGARLLIMPLGYDHAGYVKRLSAVVSAITDNQAQLKVILCQMVKLVRDGVQLKMSKRAGDFITVREVAQEVGADVLRLIMLTRKNDAPLEFDLAKVIEQSKDNPVFYIQYAHARCCSVIRKLKSELPELNLDQKIHNEILARLTDEAELNLIKKLALYPRIIEIAATNFEPHKIAFYLQDLAKVFHGLWNKGMDNPGLKFIIPEDLDVTLARFYLLTATKTIIASALSIFGIQPLEVL